MYIQDLFNPNQKKKLKGNKLVDNSKNLNSVIPQTIAMTLIKDMTHTGTFVMNRYPFLLCGIFLASNSSCNSFGRGMWAYGNVGCQVFNTGMQNQTDLWPKINMLRGQ